MREEGRGKKIRNYFQETYNLLGFSRLMRKKHERYWLLLLKESEIITKELADSMLANCEELLRITGTAKLTIRKELNGNS